MTAVTSKTDFDYAFDATKGIQRNNLPPFAQRMRKAADLVWEEGYQQPFIRELGEGTLQRERFAFYLLQDFRYVNYYARVHALGLAKTTDPEIMAFMLKVQNGALQVETEVHRSYLASYGTVSYTHLDVYKRQDMRHGVFRVISGFCYDPSNKIAGLFRVLRITVVS